MLVFLCAKLRSGLSNTLWVNRKRKGTEVRIACVLYAQDCCTLIRSSIVSFDTHF